MVIQSMSMVYSDSMMEKIKISDAELEVMKVLWKKSPLSANQIIDFVQIENDWNGKTIRTLIDRLCSKEQIAADRSSKQLMFSPLISQKDYEKKTRHLLASQLYGGSVGKLLLNFVDTEELSEQDILELRKLLDKIEK